MQAALRCRVFGEAREVANGAAHGEDGPLIAVFDGGLEMRIKAGKTKVCRQLHPACVSARAERHHKGRRAGLANNLLG